MKTLRSAEDILKEYEEINRSVFTHPAGIIQMIETAQREAIEAAAENVQNEIEQSEDDYATHLISDARDSVLNLLNPSSNR